MHAAYIAPPAVVDADIDVISATNRHMDAHDRQILALLVEDGRRTYDDIARRVSLSAPAVKRRVDRLRARGALQGFTAVVDHDALGDHTEALIELFFAPGTLLDAGRRDAARPPRGGRGLERDRRGRRDRPRAHPGQRRPRAPDHGPPARRPGPAHPLAGVVACRALVSGPPAAASRSCYLAFPCQIDRPLHERHRARAVLDAHVPRCACGTIATRPAGGVSNGTFCMGRIAALGVRRAVAPAGLQSVEDGQYRATHSPRPPFAASMPRRTIAPCPADTGARRVVDRRRPCSRPAATLPRAHVKVW